MPLQLDGTGLQTQPLSEIKSEYQSAVTDKYGAGVQVGDKSNFGKWIGIASERESNIQEAINGVYESSYLSTASGLSLDRIFEITGFTRQSASKSIVTSMYATGTGGTAVAAEELTMSVLQTGALFKNTAAFTLGVLGNKTAASITRSGTTATVTITAGHSYLSGSFVFIEGADQSEYNVLTAISNVGATTFDYELTGALPVSPATGTITVKEATNFTANSDSTGEIQALAGSLTVIETAISGIDRVENASDADEGSATDTDGEAKVDYEDSIAQLGGGTLEAIKAELLDVTDVTNVSVLQNVTDITDSGGRPPHTVEAFVESGVDADIFQAMFDSVSGGIGQYGNTTGTVTDSSGNSQPTAFSRLTTIDIFVDIVVVTNSDITQGPVFPANGKTQILDNLSSLDFDAGQDVWKATIDNAVTSVDGVVSVVSLFAKTASPATGTTIVIAIGEKADIDSGDITGTIDGVPI